MKKIGTVFAATLIPVAGFAAPVDINEAKTVVADKIEYNVKNQEIQTKGKAEITTQSGQRMTLVDSYISQSGQSIRGNEIELWLGPHVRTMSDNITRDGDITTALDATFTACYKCDRIGTAWEISADKLVHNWDTHILRFYDSIFWVYGVPVLWIPYFSRPDPTIKHKSGLLMPDFASTNKMGTRIDLPVYFAFSDTHDMTLTLGLLTQENPVLALEHRLNAPHSEYRTHGAYTRNRAGEDRWYIFNNDVIELGEYARAYVFLERASDKTFMQKYGFYNYQPYLDSGARVELFGQSGYVVGDAHVFQEMRTSRRRVAPSGNILPNIRGTYQTSPFYHETFATFSADVLSIAGDDTASQRLIGDARIVSPWTLWGGNRVTASVSTRYDLYNFDNTIGINGETLNGVQGRFLPSGYVEWGLPLFRPGENWTQIIQPRARFTVMRHTDSDQFALNNDSAGALLSYATLFSNNRFSGLDLWENGTFADYGAEWSAFNDNHNVSVFLGQTYDFTERADTDPNSGFHAGASDLVGRVVYNNTNWLDTTVRFRLDRDDLALRHSEESVRLHYSGKTYLNIGHIWSKQFDATQAINDTINEVMVGTGIQFTDRLSIQWTGRYNITYSRFQRHSGGIFYNHPCYYLSLEYQHDNAVKYDYVGNTTFQLRFGISMDELK